LSTTVPSPGANLYFLRVFHDKPTKRAVRHPKRMQEMQVYRSMDARMLEKHASTAGLDNPVCVQFDHSTNYPPPATRRTVGEVIKPAI